MKMRCQFCGQEGIATCDSEVECRLRESDLKHPGVKCPDIKELMSFGWGYKVVYQNGKFILEVELLPVGGNGGYNPNPTREDGYQPFYIKTEIDDPTEAQRRFVTIATDIHVACKKLELSTEASEKRQKQLFAEYQKNLEYEKATLRQYQKEIDRHMKNYVKYSETKK